MLRLDVRIQGIPAIVEVLSAEPAVPPGRGGYLQPPEPAQVDFRVLDRRGRHAPWLERKLTDDDVKSITRQALEA